MRQAALSEAVPLVLTDLTRTFGRFVALRAITASFQSGRLYAILGENGAGKSTLLRVIAGLLPPSRGSITVLGTTRVHSIRDELGYMAHAPLLYDELDAMENLRYFARLYGIHDEQLCASAMVRMGLDPGLKRHVGQYSQGMRQRLSLARAVLHDPRILLLDEPFSNVDITSAREMVRFLGALRDGVGAGSPVSSKRNMGRDENSSPSVDSREGEGQELAKAGKTILVVTHQAALLQEVADEFVWMQEGRIVARTAELAQGPGYAESMRSTSITAVTR